MEFPKEVMQELIWDDAEGMELIENEIIDTTRWSIVHRIVFKVEGSYYSTCYSEGATECQDESPFEYDGDMIECDEVFPTEVTRIEYLRKKEVK